jgi:uncharacterized protein DUF2442
MAEHPIHRVISFSILGPHRLEVAFEDGVVRSINFLPVLHGQVFGPLRDEALFSEVTLDPEAHTLVWPNGADFDPATLHDWPDVEPDLIRLANQWAASTHDSSQR